MGQKTAISWCDHTFNPWWGCMKVSPACQHCYAETFSKRIGLKVWGPASERRFFGLKHWREPLTWQARAERDGVRRRVFCASMADVFEIPPSLDMGDKMREARAQLAILIDQTPMLDWLLLTKRPENVMEIFPAWWLNTRQNVWIGVTVENQEYANRRIPILLTIPAVVRFVSAEPLLGPIHFADVPGFNKCGAAGQELTKNFWVIAGGESGAQCRPSDPDWFRSLRDQCQIAGVPFHFKQWGGRTPTGNGCELDGREWKEFPSRLAVPPPSDRAPETGDPPMSAEGSAGMREAERIQQIKDEFWLTARRDTISGALHGLASALERAESTAAAVTADASAPSSDVESRVSEFLASYQGVLHGMGVKSLLLTFEDFLRRSKARADASARPPSAGWQPIATAKRGVELLFWLRPKTAEEAYQNTSGHPIVAMCEPYMHKGKYGSWSSLMKAIYWHELPGAPSRAGAGTDGETR